MSDLTIFTVGHGNRPLDELVELLRMSCIRTLIDVRAHPGSRRHPHFSRHALADSLPQEGVGYDWQGGALGGRRRPQADSRNVALRNPSFRAYADHMASDEYETALAALIERARHETVAVMCAERLPWQCHRFLVSDSLVARGVTVRHIIDASRPREHKLNAIARVTPGGALIYDANTQETLGLD